MKTKSKTKAAKHEAKKPSSAQSSQPLVTGPVGSFGPATPNDLLHLAEQEPDQGALRNYIDVIRTLREKSFSYREIGEWLKEHGIEADYNAVYRVFMKYMGPQDAINEERREQEEAEEAAKQQ